VFGKQIAEVKILSAREVKSVPFSELADEKKVPTDAEIAFKAIAAKIKSEVLYQPLIHWRKSRNNEVVGYSWTVLIQS